MPISLILISDAISIPHILELQNQLPNEFEITKDSLEKEPTDPDAKKEYYVGCYSADDWHFVHEILNAFNLQCDYVSFYRCKNLTFLPYTLSNT